MDTRPTSPDFLYYTFTGDIPQQTFEESLAAQGWPLGADTEDDDELIVGDVVQLLTGSVDMVVIAACDCGTVEVAWYDDFGGMQVEVFPAEVLVRGDE